MESHQIKNEFRSYNCENVFTGITGSLVPQYSWSRLGNAIIILGEHRFKKRSNRPNQRKEVHWVCNKSDKGCKAKLTTLNDAIVKMYNVHTHENKKNQIETIVP